MRSYFYELIRPQLRWEGNTRVPATLDKVAVVAQFSMTRVMTHSFYELVRQLAEADYFVLISSACTDPRPLEWPGPLPENIAILRKPNIGYDFGSWAAAMLHAPQVFEANVLLQVNDSLVGPFWSMRDILTHFERDPHDWWGLVRSDQVAWHYQSYFLGFKQSALRSNALRSYWESVRVHADKRVIIDRYEYGLSTRMHNEGFVSGSFLVSARVVNRGMNPMIDGWLQALKAGIPFIKRELLTRPEVVPMGDRVPQILRDEFDIDVRDWV